MNVDQRHEERRLRIVESTTRMVLFDGNFCPSVEEIGENAGISRTALNYYFDSKDDLMNEIRNFSLGLWKSKLDKLFFIELPLENRIVEFVDFSLDLTSSYHFLELFLSIDQGSKTLIKETIQFSDKLICSLCDEFSSAMAAGKIYNMDPLNAVFNLLSITDQPFRILSFKLAGDNEVRNFAQHFRKEKRELLLRSIFV